MLLCYGRFTSLMQKVTEDEPGFEGQPPWMAFATLQRVPGCPRTVNQEGGKSVSNSRQVEGRCPWCWWGCIQDHKWKETTQNPKCGSCVFSFPPHFVLLTVILLFLFWDYQDAVGLGGQPSPLAMPSFPVMKFLCLRESLRRHTRPPLSLLTLFSLGFPSRPLLSACQFSLLFLVKQEESGWSAEKKTLAFAFL